VSAELDYIWSRVQTDLITAVDESTYRIWLEPLRPVELCAGRLTVAAPARTRPWIADRFGRVLQTCVTAAAGPTVTLTLVSSGGGEPDPLDPVEDVFGLGPAPPAGPAEALATRRRAALNPKFTFEQFVIGDSNRLAHAAALAVAELPSEAYNPLFIYGPPGLGKTHLLHSIGAFLAAHAPSLDVRYTTGEAFTNEFVSALRDGSLTRFKARFRRVDVLLIDDVQFLERKTRTEEEFFHTFNALSDMGSQVVVTCDRLPRDLQALEQRLRDRFEAGLLADVKPPDLPTRLTILRKRVAHDGIEIADPASLEVIADNVRDNVRALEGALIRVVAYASLTGRPLTAELVTDVMQGLYAQNPRTHHSVADVQAAACEHFGLSADELLSPTRATRVSWPRHVAMYVARELTKESLPAIGRQFGGRDHTTVLHACRRTAERMSTDSSAKASVTELLARLSSVAPDRPS
jgi:chromosomal replication initiator protein